MILPCHEKCCTEDRMVGRSMKSKAVAEKKKTFEAATLPVILFRVPFKTLRSSVVLFCLNENCKFSKVTIHKHQHNFKFKNI